MKPSNEQILRDALRPLINFCHEAGYDCQLALAALAATEPDTENCPIMGALKDSHPVIEALHDLARMRNEHEKTLVLNANIDKQIKNVEEQLASRKDRRSMQVTVEFDRRVTSEDRRASIRRIDIRREFEK